MTMPSSLVIVIAITIAGSTIATAADQLKCDIGPVNKTYGNTSWLVYSCSDGQSIVVVSAPGNPAGPFYFIVHPDATGYQIEGEGTGAKAESDAALAEIKTLSAGQIDALIEQTKHPQNPN